MFLLFRLKRLLLVIQTGRITTGGWGRPAARAVCWPETGLRLRHSVVRRSKDICRARECENEEIWEENGAELHFELITVLRDLAFIKVPTLLVYFTPSKVSALAV